MGKSLIVFEEKKRGLKEIFVLLFYIFNIIVYILVIVLNWFLFKLSENSEKLFETSGTFKF